MSANDLSQNLKTLRKQCGFTQKLVADSLSIDRSTYTYYETGKSYPTVETLCKLARIFGVTVDVLIQSPKDYSAYGMLPLNDDTHTYYGRYEPTSFSASESPMATNALKDDEKKLLVAYRQLPEQQKREVSNLANTLLQEQEE